MMEDFAWFLRACALRDYKIWSEAEGELSTRAYHRCMRFMALADVLYPLRSPFDLEYEYQREYYPDDEEY